MARRDFAASRFPGFASVTFLVFAALYLPIILLVAYSFNSGESIAIWEGFSFRWYPAAWGNATVREVTLRSLTIASLASVIATLVATMAALGTTRRRRTRGQGLIYLMINQPLMAPEIVTAVALLMVFASVRVTTGYQGPGYLILAHTAFCIPFAYLPIRARLEGMDRSLEMAASDLYATPWQAFRHVTLPLLVPGILAGLMLAFVTSLDDVVITLFVKSAGQDTLPTYMLAQLRRSVSAEMNAISTLLLLPSVITLVAFLLLTRKRDRRE